MRKVTGLLTPLVNINGKPFENDGSQYGVIIHDVLALMQGPKTNGMEKARAMQLSIKLLDKDEFDFEDADIALIGKALDIADLVNFMDYQVRVKLGMIEQPK